jgi:hypothetical protein
MFGLGIMHVQRGLCVPLTHACFYTVWGKKTPERKSKRIKLGNSKQKSWGKREKKEALKRLANSRFFFLSCLWLMISDDENVGESSMQHKDPVK